jgi:nucleoside-diphosphate-sugar epimerase
MPFDVTGQELAAERIETGKTVTREKRILLVGGCGYIGSFLDTELRDAGYDVDVCDYLARGLPHRGRVPLFPTSHVNITNNLVREYDTVLWFAGKSSVKAAEDDPQGALSENCIHLADLRRRMRPDARLIYASSASLYSQSLGDNREPRWSDEDDVIGHGITAYDRSKACMDSLTVGFFDNTVALRMGTLCGYSPNLRPELVFNAMCLSALKERVVYVANAVSWRSILFLPDLAETVKACIEAKDIPTILNVATVSLPMGLLATNIARMFRTEIERLPDSPTYNFKIRTTRMLEMLKYSPMSVRLENHISSFAESVKKAGLVE